MATRVLFAALVALAACQSEAALFLRRRRGANQKAASIAAHDAGHNTTAEVWCGNRSNDELVATQLKSTWDPKDVDEDSQMLAAHKHDSGNGVVHQVVQPLNEARNGLLMATLAGAATTLGAIALPCMPPAGPPPNVMAFAMSLAAGVMVAVALEMLAPGAHCILEGSDVDCAKVGARPLLIAGVGALATWLLCKGADRLHPEPQAPQAKVEGGEEPTEGEGERQQNGYRLALLLFVALTAHNIPEGFAVAISAHSSQALAWSVCIAVALHNIPEGLTLAVATYAATKSRVRSTVVPLVAGLAEPLGALVAVLLLSTYITPRFINDMLAGVAGVMAYIAFFELIPEAISTKCWLMTGIGFFAGMAVMIITHHALEEHA